MTTSRTLGWGPRELDGITVLQCNGLFEAGTPVQSDIDRRFTKLVGFWAPRRWLTTETMDIDVMVAELEEIITARGFVAYDGQVITSLRRVEPCDACVEAISIDTPLEIPERRHWGPEQRAYFGVENKRYRPDKDAREADTIDDLRALLPARAGDEFHASGSSKEVLNRKDEHPEEER